MEHVRKSCETKSTNKIMTLEKMWPCLGVGVGEQGREPAGVGVRNLDYQLARGIGRLRTPTGWAGGQ